ncbi:MAG TPA: hypothetical protein VK203_04680 [Nostocaceae cyanobacterium]|nr:hypothetical protein [Nostocaceae cyanobacterium]
MSEYNEDGDLEQNIIIKIPKSTRNSLITRFIVTLICGGILAYFYTVTSQAQLDKAEKLTKEEYIENFPAYKAKLRDTFPPSVAPIMGLLAACILIGPYELMVFLVGLLLGKILK